MRLCFVYEYYFPHVGGGEVLIQNLAEGLARRGHQCTVVTARLPGTLGREYINGVEIRRVPVPHLGDRYWFTLISLPLVLAEVSKADIVHAPTYNGAIAAWLAGRLKKKPVVFHPFEVLNSMWRKLGLNPFTANAFLVFEKLLLAFPFEGYSCISQFTRQSLVNAGIPAKKTFLAYPGVDYSLFNPGRHSGRDSIRKKLGVADNTFLCMYAGRPGIIKGLDLLLGAIARVRQQIPDARFLLLIARHPRRKYRETIDSLAGFKNNEVIVHDSVEREELPSFFQASDCVIVPSLSEGFGFTCVEACAMDRPVVASCSGSLPEVVSGKYVMVTPGSSDAIARGILRIYQGDFDVSEVKRFSWNESVEKHLRFYEKLLLDPELSGKGGTSPRGGN